MKTTRILEYEMPKFLPHGWQVEIAKKSGWRRNTVYNVKKRGESHPLYGRMKKVLPETYGKPIQSEAV